MSIKTYQLYCDFCGYKRITDGSDVQDLKEIKTSPIPGGAPILDPFGKKTITPVLHQPAETTGGIISSKPSPQRKKFKCPKCGRVIMARQIQRTEHLPSFDNNNEDINQLNFP